MPDRKDLDRPATTMLAVFGLVFMAASIPFLPNLYCKSPSHNPDLCEGAPGASGVAYDVAWAAGTADHAATTVDAAPAAKSVSVAPAHIAPATALLTFDTCSDSANGNLQQPAATFTWELRRGGALLQKSDKAMTCADLPGGRLVVSIQLAAKPDLGAVTAANDTAARAAARHDPRVPDDSSTYYLNVTTARNASPIPPVGPLALTFRMGANLEITTWEPAVNRHATEVAK